LDYTVVADINAARIALEEAMDDLEEVTVPGEGWVERNGEWFFYEDGSPLTSWFGYPDRDYGPWYYLSAAQGGARVSGAYFVNGWWEFDTDGQFVGPYDGWAVENGDILFIVNDERLTGWTIFGTEVGERVFYFTEDGVMATGWQGIGDDWFYFTDNPLGAMVTGPYFVNGWWEFTIGGVFVGPYNGWDVDGDYFIFVVNGERITGWTIFGFGDGEVGNFYFTTPQGHMATGWVYTATDGWQYFTTAGVHVPQE
jgi:glucan-binding YG repeat protein